MTELLKKAFDQASRLPAEEQDRLASFILADLESERRWDEAFAGNPDALATLADEALTEAREGKAEPLVPGEL
jgi:urease gamma subunit